MAHNKYLDKYKHNKALQDKTRIGELQNQRAELVKSIFLSEDKKAELKLDEEGKIVPNRHNGMLLRGKLECLGTCLDEMQKVLDERMEQVASDPSTFYKNKNVETGEDYIRRLGEIHQAAEDVRQVTKSFSSKLRADEITEEILNEDLSEPLAKLGKSTNELHALGVLGWSYFGPSYKGFNHRSASGGTVEDTHPIIVVGRTALDLSKRIIPELTKINQEISRLSQTQVE